MKAMESCWGEDNMKTYTVQLKKAISKCHATDAPELELPVYRSPFRFINTIIRSGQQHQENLMEAVQSMARNMAHNMMQSNGMQNQQFNNYNMMMQNQFQNQNRFQQQYQPNNFHHQGRNDMNYNMMNGQNFQGQKYRENMQSNNMPYDQVMDTVSMMKFMREFMENKYNRMITLPQGTTTTTRITPRSSSGAWETRAWDSSVKSTETPNLMDLMPPTFPDSWSSETAWLRAEGDQGTRHCQDRKLHLCHEGDECTE